MQIKAVTLSHKTSADEEPNTVQLWKKFMLRKILNTTSMRLYDTRRDNLFHGWVCLVEK